jgi:hypothetical protein
MAVAPMWAYCRRIPSAFRPYRMTSSSDLHWWGSSANPAFSAMTRSMFTSPKSKSAIMIVPRSV